LIAANATRGISCPDVLVFYLFDRAPPLLILLLAIMVYLAFIEVRNEPDMAWQVKLWWILLVFLTNFLGLIALRIYVTVRRRRRNA
jgi:TctA family transporter